MNTSPSRDKDDFPRSSSGKEAKRDKNTKDTIS